MGSGLGRQFSVRLPDTAPYRSSTARSTTSASTSSFEAGSSAPRCSAVVLLLFVRDAWKAWRGSTQSRDAALALAAVAVTTGFVAKGAVESVLEKGKLATVVGLAFGVVARIADDVQGRPFYRHQHVAVPGTRRGFARCPSTRRTDQRLGCRGNAVAASSSTDDRRPPTVARRSATHDGVSAVRGTWLTDSRDVLTVRELP